MKDNLWLSSDDAAALSSALLPKLEKTQKAVKDILYEVSAWRLCFVMLASIHLT